ncbi:hypothetical protein GCM10022252_76210 [Streptosporangium oxazolinicum]|uniref:DUF397 domain-containing protein n=1 Tax=Streptosporangium oxazolinicum TaxID=909287 RepID=A0ABP8BLT4_9ACTN
MASFADARTARIRHVPGLNGGCEVCLNTIEPGQKYVRFSATPHSDEWDGDTWAHIKAHAPAGRCIQKEGTSRG